MWLVHKPHLVLPFILHPLGLIIQVIHCFAVQRIHPVMRLGEIYAAGTANIGKKY